MIGLLVVGCLSPGLARADGALAIGATAPIVEGGFAYGFTRHFGPGPAAQSAAVNTCRGTSHVPQTAESCRVVGLITDQCFAVAFTPVARPTGYGWAIDPGRQTAARKAMDGCSRMAGDNAADCRIIESRCDGTALSDRCVGWVGASPDQRAASCTALIQSGDEADNDLISDYVNRGNANAARDAPDAAIDDYGEALKRNPAYAIAFYDRGSAYRLKHDYDHAIGDYDRAIALNPRYEDAFVNRGAAYAAKGDADRAINDYTVALFLDGSDAAAYRNRGDAYVDKGDLTLALPDYDEAIRRAPGDADGYRSRGYLRFYAGDFAKAADDLARVVSAEPDDLYAPLWAYLAGARADAASAKTRLADAAAQASGASQSAWPHPVVDLLLGAHTFDATLAATTTPSRNGAARRSSTAARRCCCKAIAPPASRRCGPRSTPARRPSSNTKARAPSSPGSISLDPFCLRTAPARAARSRLSWLAEGASRSGRTSWTRPFRTSSSHRCHRTPAPRCAASICVGRSTMRSARASTGPSSIARCW